MNNLTYRRTFLKTSVIAVAGGNAFSARSWAQVAGANSDIRIAVLGLNGRGRNHLTNLKAIPGVRIVALCDIDTAVLEKAKTSLGANAARSENLHRHPRAARFAGHRCNHGGHAEPLAFARRHLGLSKAGKDVYVEKPVCHNIWRRPPARGLAAANIIALCRPARRSVPATA